MKGVDREIHVVHRGEGCGKAHAAELRLRAKLEVLEIHLQSAAHSSAEGANRELRDDQMLLRHLVIAPCLHSARVEPLIRHSDIVAVVVPAGGPFARDVTRLAGEIRDAIRRGGLAENRAHVRKRKPPAIPEIPIRPGEAGQLGAKVQLRVRQRPDQFVELERIAMKRELCGNIESKRKIAPLGHLHLLDPEASDVGFGAGRGSVEVQQKFKTSPAKLKRGAAIVDGRSSVAKLELADAQAEERLTPGTVAGADFRRRQIALTALIEPHGHLRVIHQEGVERDLPAPKGKNMNLCLHPSNVKEWRRSSRLGAVQRQIVHLDAQPESVEMKCAQLDLRAGSLLQLVHDDTPDHSLHEPGFECHDDHGGSDKQQE